MAFRTTRTKTTALFADAQFSRLADHVIALVAALSRRSFEVLGETIPPETLVTAVSSVLSRAAKDKLSEALTGPIVSMRAVREAQAPLSVGYVTLTPEPTEFALVDELAQRLHGEVNHATRSIVLQAALDHGLQLMQRDGA